MLVSVTSTLFFFPDKTHKQHKKCNKNKNKKGYFNNSHNRISTGNKQRITRKSTTALAHILANTRYRVDKTLQDDKHSLERLALQ